MQVASQSNQAISLGEIRGDKVAIQHLIGELTSPSDLRQAAEFLFGDPAQEVSARLALDMMRDSGNAEFVHAGVRNLVNRRPYSWRIEEGISRLVILLQVKLEEKDLQGICILLDHYQTLRPSDFRKGTVRTDWEIPDGIYSWYR